MADLERDIARYRNGEMTPAEMHALEKRALDDPFLEEALEGLDSIAPNAADGDLAELQKKLETRIQKKPARVVPLWIWPARIAAGLLILVVATVVIFRISESKKPEQLAMTNDAAPEPATDEEEIRSAQIPAEEVEKQKSDAIEQEKPTPPPAAAKPIEERKRPDEVTTAAPPAVDAEARELADETQLAEDKIVTLDGVVSGPKREEEPIDDAAREQAPNQAAVPAKKTEARTARSRASEANQKAAAGAAVASVAADETSGSTLVTGAVKDDEGHGIPGVNVTIKGSTEGTVTDVNGHYQISVRKPATLVYSFIGYSAKEVETGTENQIDVALSPDVAQLSEVVVVGYGANQQTDNDAFSNLEFAEPQGGHRAYREYLENNLRYPEEAIKNNVEGRVTIQFTVQTNGQLTDFNVVRGIGFGCDDEVIRLIKEGPVWSPTKRGETPMPDKVKVRLKFSLPEKK